MPESSTRKAGHPALSNPKPESSFMRQRLTRQQVTFSGPRSQPQSFPAKVGRSQEIFSNFAAAIWGSGSFIPWFDRMLRTPRPNPKGPPTLKLRKWDRGRLVVGAWNFSGAWCLGLRALHNAITRLPLPPTCFILHPDVASLLLVYFMQLSNEEV